jgi:hypothetical protein
MTDFEFYQTEYLGGKISQTHAEYKDFAMKETGMSFARWFILNSERLAQMSPDKALSEILDTRAKLEYLSSTTEITQMSMKLGELAKKSDARNLGGILKRARDGIVITDK